MQKACKEKAVSFAARERTDTHIGATGREEEVAEISNDVLAFAANFDPVGSRSNGFSDSLIEVELFAKLVEVCDLQVCAELDLSRVRLEFPEDQLDERAFAGAIGTDKTKAVAAHQREVQILHDDMIAERFGESRNLGNDLSAFSPASIARRIDPICSRRAARSRRSASSRRTRPSLRVRRASMPLRIQTSSCAQNLSNRRRSSASAASSSSFRAS